MVLIVSLDMLTDAFIHHLLELAMEYSFTPWIAARARRLRLYRILVNCFFWPLLSVILVINLARWLLPAVSPIVWAALWIPFALAMYIIGIPWFVAGAGFMWGLIKCHPVIVALHQSFRHPCGFPRPARIVGSISTRWIEARLLTDAWSGHDTDCGLKRATIYQSNRSTRLMRRTRKD